MMENALLRCRPWDVLVVCPYCNEEQGGWNSDPRGHSIECEFCEKEFMIEDDSQLEVI
jgi:hypothetical protein